MSDPTFNAGRDLPFDVRQQVFAQGVLALADAYELELVLFAPSITTPEGTLHGSGGVFIMKDLRAAPDAAEAFSQMVAAAGRA